MEVTSNADTTFLSRHQTSLTGCVNVSITISECYDNYSKHSIKLLEKHTLCGVSMVFFFYFIDVRLKDTTIHIENEKIKNKTDVSKTIHQIINE